MDILDLDAGLANLAHNGFCLNLEEKLKLELGLSALLNKATREDFEELRFWGRIQCVKGDNPDYYIAVGITYNGKYEFPSKRFYYASGSNFEFEPFPEINTQHENCK